MNELSTTMRRLLRATAMTLLAALSGCAIYHPLPLASRPNLAQSLDQLNHVVPSNRSVRPSITLELNKPLTPDEVGMLAVLNNPELVAQHGALDAARATMVSATLLPNPSINYSYQSLKSGPGTSNATAASISEDIRSIITYHTRAKAARFRFRQVQATLLWQEWQVAQKARLLAVKIAAGRRQVAVRRRELGLLDDELTRVRAATLAGNLDLAAEAPLLAAKASAEIAIASARMNLLRAWQNLDALLGLEPSVRFAVDANPTIQLPPNIDALIQSLPDRRPDLVALRLGYQAAQADVRAAIISQFPAFSLGFSRGTDTSDVTSAGPEITMDLPIFDRNQGRIALTRATRLRLHADYQARLDRADGTITALRARRQAIIAYLQRARTAAREAGSHARAALRAYKQGNLSQRNLTDYETTALERRINVLDYSRALTETNLALLIELGAGFPQTALMPSDQVK